MTIKLIIVTITITIISIIIITIMMSSLLHDDVIDHAESRRGKESVNKRFNPSRSILSSSWSSPSTSQFSYFHCDHNIIIVTSSSALYQGCLQTISFFLLLKLLTKLSWTICRSIFAGDYILGVSAKLLAQTGNPDVVIAMSQVMKWKMMLIMRRGMMMMARMMNDDDHDDHD